MIRVDFIGSLANVQFDAAGAGGSDERSNCAGWLPAGAAFGRILLLRRHDSNRAHDARVSVVDCGGPPPLSSRAHADTRVRPNTSQSARGLAHSRTLARRPSSGPSSGLP